MRRLAAAAVAVPVIAVIYLATAWRVPMARRAGASVLVFAFAVTTAVALAMPSPGASMPPSRPTALPQSLFHPLNVADAESSTPATLPTPGGASAAPSGSSATPSPSAQPTLLSVETTVVGAGQGNAPSLEPLARNQHDAPTVPAPAGSTAPSPSPLTPTSRPTPASTPAASGSTGTVATLTTSTKVGNRIPLNGQFIVSVNQQSSLSAVRAALTISPSVKGTLSPAAGSTSGTQFVFTPATSLKPDTPYTVSLRSTLQDMAGDTVSVPNALTIRTIAQPHVVRYQPADNATNEDRTRVISVRFSRPMDHASTEKAFSVVVAGKDVAGKLYWSEGDTVLAFAPSSPFAYGAGVGVRVAGTAQSQEGAELLAYTSWTFTVAEKPTPTPATTTTGSSTSTSSASSGGGSVGGGAWAALESYYLTLMNCTRTGGWVQADGSCTNGGTRDVKPLWIDKGISDKVTRPYAKLIVTRDICTHFADGNPGDRLARAGYTSYKWAENMSCPQSENSRAAMIYTQRYFQNEKSYNGGHYVNLMNPVYDRVGIGVWVANGLTEVVIDFYHP